MATSSRSSSSSSSSRSSSTSKSSSPPKSATSSSKPSTTGKSISKPGSTISTSDGKQVTSSAKPPTNTKYSQANGVVGDNGYTPKFSGGYTAPVGSVVYYPQHSFIDYLPWIYLFSQSSPHNDQVTVVQPDGSEVTTKPEEGGVDGMLIFNWILLVLMAAAVIAGIVWAINKLTKKGTKV